jgi:RES domain-containing protein
VTLWRLSNHVAVDGRGGLHASGRWHTRGRRVAYCAHNPATALLEVLVHLEIDMEDVPSNWRFLEIDVPDGIASEAVPPSQLPRDWQKQVEATREIGDLWLDRSASALLHVPSVLVPETTNVLLNPSHPDAKLIRIRKTHPHTFDPRLLY